MAPPLPSCSAGVQGSAVAAPDPFGAKRKLPYDTTVHRARDWSEYPVGTKAHAIGGGHWYRIESGWKWNGPAGTGSTFPTPGGDAYCVILPGAELVGEI